MLRALKNFVVTLLAAVCLSGLSARSDDIPTLDVNPVCHGIAMQGELEAVFSGPVFSNACKVSKTFVSS